MESREPRFSLRFESGAREGERVPLSSDVSTVGRRGDNTIAVSHASVSGHHAELRMEGQRVFVSDAGSTNGTRVNGAKIGRHELAHGDRIAFGSVHAVFVDASFAGGSGDEDDEVLLEDTGEVLVLDDAMPAAVIPAARPPAAQPMPAPAAMRASAPAPTGAPSDATLGSVSSERLAASRSGSKVWIAWIVVLAAAGGGAFVWLDGRKADGGTEPSAAVAVPGNVLDDGAFENPDAAPWTNAEAGPQAFFVDGGFALSGRSGLGVLLATDEWALAHSAPFRVPEGKALALRASLDVEGGANGRVGIELTQSTPSRGFTAPPIRAWAPARTSTSGFEEVELVFDTLPGYDTGRVLVAGHADAAEGDVSLDDVSVVLESAAGGPVARFQEYELHILGDPGSTAVVVRSGRVLFSSLGLSRWSDESLTGASAAFWTGAATPTGFELSVQGPADGATLRVVSCGGRALAPDDSSPPWLSTIGPDGYLAHATTFEREAATDLLTGGGVNLIRFGVERPVPMSSVMHAESARFRIGFDGLRTLQVQLSFREERDEANQIASRARTAEKGGEFGASIHAWSELLDRFPFDAALIAEAEEARARLTQAGHERVRAVRQEIERAGFFELVDLYRNCRASAARVAKTYAGSEIEAAANELTAQVDAELSALSSGRAGGSVARLKSVLDALDARENPALVEHVKAAIAAQQDH